MIISLMHLRIGHGLNILASRISMTLELPNWWERQKSFIHSRWMFSIESEEMFSDSYSKMLTRKCAKSERSEFAMKHVAAYSRRKTAREVY